MGCTSSKIQHEDAVGKCEQRKSLVKQAVAARTGLASAHARYVQSLSSISLAFRQFADGEFRDGSSSSVSSSSAAVPSSASSSSSAAALIDAEEIHLSSAGNAFAAAAAAAAAAEEESSPQSSSEIVRNTSAMRLWNTPTEPVTVVLSPPRRSPPQDYFIHFGGGSGGGVAGFQSPPAPPAPPANEWEYLDIFHPPPAVRRYQELEEDIPALELSDEDFRAIGKAAVVKREVKEEEEEEEEEIEASSSSSSAADSSEDENADGASDGAAEMQGGSESKNTGEASSVPKEGGGSVPVSAPIQLADVLRKLEDQFLMASENGKSVLRMLEARKVHNQLERGTSDHSSRLLSALSLGHWSPRALNSPREGLDNEESGGMSGSHAATLDRLYAWEKKLFEEVKSWEGINSELDRKRKLLRNLDARGAKPDAIDRTRASMKALETEISVAVQAMEASSTEIQRITDDEILPQLLELLKGLAEMWEGMHECHQQQLGVVMQLKLPENSALEATSTSHRNTTVQLESALTTWHASLRNFIQTQKEYVMSLNRWIKSSILPDQSTRRAKKTPLPKIQHLSEKWLAALDKLSMADVSGRTRELTDTLREINGRHFEEIRIHKRADGLAKELNKKILSLNSFEKKVMDSKQKRGDGGKAQIAEKRGAVESLRTRVGEEQQRYNRAVQQTRSFTVGSLQTSLPPLFQALEAFAGICKTTHQELYAVVNSYAPVATHIM